MGTLRQLKSYLKKLDYPNLNILSDEDVAEIFSVENRKGFLTWFIQKLNPRIILPQNPQESRNIIADTLREHGFCKSSEKYVFVQGDCNLEASKQSEIVERMLSFLADEQEDKENLDASCIIMNVEDITQFVNTDINLFPSYGSMRSRKHEEHLKKIEDIDKKIVEVNKEILFLQSEENNFNNYIHSTDEKQKDYINVLEEATLVFHDLVEFLMKYRAKKENHFEPRFSNGINEMVGKCDAEVRKVADVVQSLSAISNFSKNFDANMGIESKEKEDIITQLAILSNEVKVGNNMHIFS